MPIQFESDLYDPIKGYLQNLGYTVKGEIKGVDLVATHPDKETVLVELKKSFSIKLLLQGIERLALSDRVYLAVPASTSSANIINQQHKSVKNLCRRLGLGLIQVYFGPRTTRVDILVDPEPYRPRKNKIKSQALHNEFENRRGDPNTGGVTRKKIMTAYRQQALQLATCVAEQDNCTLAEMREITGVLKAAGIVQNNHYGWFERVSRGTYRLTELGVSELSSFSE
jgi:hypothetical protein